MELIKRKRESVLARCENCGREIEVPFGNIASGGSRSYELKAAVRCECGEYHNLIVTQGEVQPTRPVQRQEPDDDTVRCPRCGSSQIHAGDKGFSVGKALVGSVLGPEGLLAGFLGSKKTMITCLKCGHRWLAGKR